MGCYVSIRSDLANYPGGGVWTFVGYHPSSNVGPFNQLPATPLVPVGLNTELLSFGDDFTVDSDNASTGYHKFTYALNGSTYNFIIKVVSRSVNAGGGGTVSVAAGSTNTIDLDVYRVDNGGVWSVVSGSPGSNFNTATGVLDLNGLAAGVYVFKYSLVEAGFVNKSCDFCPPQECQVTVNVTANLVVAVSSVDVPSCTSEIIVKHPDTAVANQGKIVVSANATEAQLQIDYDVSKCGQSWKSVTDYPLVTGVKGWVGPCSSVGFATIGSAVKSIVVMNSANGTLITVPTSPTTATLSGAYGTVQATDLIISTTTETNFVNSLTTVFKNSSLLSAIPLDNFKFYLVGAVSTGATVCIGSYAPYTPTSTVYGIHSFTVEKDGVDTTFTMSANKTILKESNRSLITEQLNDTCPGLLQAMIRSVVADNLVAGGTTYDSLQFIAQPVSLLYSNDYIRSKNCAGKTLTATVSNNVLSPTYSWSGPQGYVGNTQSVNVLDSGTYTVTVTADGNTATSQIQITI
jgi:hypothetical protein